MPAVTSPPAYSPKARCGDAISVNDFDTVATATALEAACRKLSSEPDAERVIVAFVEMMTNLARGAHGKPGTAPPSFSRVGRASCERELSDLAKHARKLANCIEQLHEPTILALAEVGIFGTIRFALPAELRQIARQAGHADVKQVPIKAGRGRKANIRAETVAKIAGKIYRQLTGRHLSYTTDLDNSARIGQWPVFLKSVFRAMRMDGYGDHLVRTLASEMKQTGHAEG